MKVLILYQDVPSGSKVATEAIIDTYVRLFPQDTLIIHKQPPNRFNGKFSFFRNLTWSIVDFWKLFQKVSDVSCIYSAMYTFSVAKTFSRLRNVPSVFHLHGDQRFIPTSLPIYNVRGLYVRILSKLVIGLQKYAVSASSVICFVSEISRNEFLQAYKLMKYKTKTIIVPNGVSTKTFYPISEMKKKQLRSKLHYPYKRIFLYVGRMDEKKGVKELLLAFKQLNLPDIGLIIAYPPYYDEYSRKYHLALRQMQNQLKLPNIHFIQDYRDIRQLYQLSDLLVLLSKQEMMPLVVLESLACGTPVLVTQMGFLPRLLSSMRKYSLLTSDGTAEVVMRMRKILQLSVQEREALIQKGFLAVKPFSWDTTATNLHQVFCKLS